MASEAGAANVGLFYLAVRPPASLGGKRGQGGHT